MVPGLGRGGGGPRAVHLEGLSFRWEAVRLEVMQSQGTGEGGLQEHWVEVDWMSRKLECRVLRKEQGDSLDKIVG